MCLKGVCLSDFLLYPNDFYFSFFPETSLSLKNVAEYIPLYVYKILTTHILRIVTKTSFQNFMLPTVHMCQDTHTCTTPTVCSCTYVHEYY